jgi:hypothetical protein
MTRQSFSCVRIQPPFRRMRHDCLHNTDAGVKASASVWCDRMIAISIGQRPVAATRGVNTAGPNVSTSGFRTIYYAPRAYLAPAGAAGAIISFSVVGTAQSDDNMSVLIDNVEFICEE